MICKRCGLDKPEDEFMMSWHNKRHYICRRCMHALSEEGKAKKRAELAARGEIYRLDFIREKREYQQRVCLRCGKQFESTGKQNRLCKTCRYIISVSGVEPSASTPMRLNRDVKKKIIGGASLCG